MLLLPAALGAAETTFAAYPPTMPIPMAMAWAIWSNTPSERSSAMTGFPPVGN